MTVDAPNDASLSDWNEIQKGSQNGIFLLILTLGWWAVASCNQGNEEMGKWADALDDLQWVLGFILFQHDKEKDQGESAGQTADKDSDGSDVDGGKSVPAKHAPTTQGLPIAKRSV